MSTMSGIERCAECRFDASAYTHNDILGTLRAIPGWWDLITRGLEDQVAQRRATADQWSILEYATHTAMITRVHAAGLTIALDTPGADLGPLEYDDRIDTTPATPSRIDTLMELTGAFIEITPLATRLPESPGSHFFLGGERVDAAWLIRHTCHDALHHLQDVGRIVHALGAGPTPQTGHVAQINVSGGGVPKRAVDSVEVGYRGIVGDRQKSRRHHGRVWQALCLYSLEAIDRLRAEGHPIAAGAAGENLTLAGIDWSSLRPGVRIRIGDAVAELTLPALPCAKNAQWFTDGNFNRMHHQHHWNETRWYARVIQDGAVNIGAQVEVEPASTSAP